MSTKFYPGQKNYITELNSMYDEFLAALVRQSTNLSTGITGTLGATNGGTGLNSYAVGDLLFASTATALSKLASVAAGNVLVSGGVGAAPAWGKVGLTTHITGVLPVANGGTNALDAPNARLNLGVTSRASFSIGSDNSVGAVTGASTRALANPSTDIGYASGVRFRFGFANDVSGNFADIIDLSTYTDASGGGYNSLYFNKSSQQMQHKFAINGGTTWTTKTLAYTDSSITGTAANVTGTVPVTNGGTGSTTAAGARVSLGSDTLTCVRNLIGQPDATTPLTKFTLSHKGAVYRNANGDKITRSSSSHTVDFGLAGSIVNGRDQAAVFAANTWVHLYFITDGNGNNSALIASLADPFVSNPTLPAGYTHWVYATTIRWNASSNIANCRVVGTRVLYPGAIGVVGGGGATTETPISISGAVPPNALRLQVNSRFSVVTTSGGGYLGYLQLRVVTAIDYWLIPCAVQIASGTGMGGGSSELPYLGTNIFYLFANESGAANVSSRGATIEIMGYTIANGDA